ncbi:putative Yop proteins translocation protein T [Candidatus Competibacter denitrificans Run_A_D11]|uniref:Yop proteins translocation protein T n=1 Tax=Candidatus Competibacter denitrificans Run_A_D11 TaxID=1400863 RepID=W6M9U7_9GAMM|nr:type III secretion system export apparatus subunit SctT [Candidatus Competibacter denitrificans]CDI03424.1 putative Yop proteins translocation protein T [Candidatus Competibacter denitrificans Run_A_D11]
METAELRQLLLTFSVALPRLLLALTTLPLLRRQVLPGLTRNAVVFTLAVSVLPVAATGLPAAPHSTAWLLGILLKEAFIGLVIGYVTSVLFWAVEAIGFFIDNQRGATMASSLNPLTEEQTSPLGILLSQVMAVLFFSGGGFLVYLGGIYQSYRLWPVASFYPRISLDAAVYFLNQLDVLMYLAVFLAGPVIVAMFLVEFGMGLIGRFSPQLNVFFLAMPVKSALANWLLVAYIAMLVYFFSAEFQRLSTLLPRLRGLLE